MWTKLDDIHLNPVRIGWVEKASHYMCSTASNSINDDGWIESEKEESEANSTGIYKVFSIKRENKLIYKKRFTPNTIIK